MLLCRSCRYFRACARHVTFLADKSGKNKNYNNNNTDISPSPLPSSSAAITRASQRDDNIEREVVDGCTEKTSNVRVNQRGVLFTAPPPLLKLFNRFPSWTNAFRSSCVSPSSTFLARRFYFSNRTSQKANY